MEEQKMEDQFDPDNLGEQIRQHIATVEGVLDQAMGDVAKMRDALMKNGYDLTYEESHGDHSWRYWDDKIRTVLKWLGFEPNM